MKFTKKILTGFFLLMTFGVLIGTTSCTKSNTPQMVKLEAPERPAGQDNVLQLRCDPIPTVRVAFIGLGSRGLEAVRRFMYLEGIEVVAICDINKDFVSKTQELLTENNKPKALEFTGEEDWKKVCELENVDLIYNCTHWALHTPIAVYAMEQGKHIALEVPAAMSIEDCWKLVDTAEKTRRHCMMLENCCYDFFEMATLNMAQQGLLGEIVHAEGAYIHDLRELNFKSPEEGGYQGMWRLDYNAKNKANLYPTHGLGPVCQALNIHRGDKMNYLVSMSSDQFGMTEYAKNKFGENSDYAKRTYEKGDINTTIIKTEKGKTIMIQHDVTSPRPYNRIHMLSGTKGFVQKYPIQGIALEPNAHEFLPEKEMEKLLKEYEHPIVKEVGEKAKEVGGHGGMDFIMDYRLIYCLRNGLPLDQDVYDAAEWSSLVELTEISVRNGSIPVEVPDFTRGDWNKLQKLEFAK
ncbi:Glycosyl hydrolase family 109 protein 1 [bioreactor metagenome]|uniref:Glycosyl hydrolase family 109 protein 1 n=1 Tax=bioreactor metagenome TaxID=1076179 RepID=A0A644W4B1_9ZZZZ